MNFDSHTLHCARVTQHLYRARERVLASQRDEDEMRCFGLAAESAFWRQKLSRRPSGPATPRLIAATSN